MRRVLLATILVLLFSAVTNADPIDLKTSSLNLPDVKGGVIYMPQRDDSEIQGATMATIAKYTIPKVKMTLDLDAIYGIENLVGGGIALELGSLAQVPGFEVPFAQFLDISVGGGLLYDFNAAQSERDKDELNWCVYATAVKIKF